MSGPSLKRKLSSPFVYLSSSEEREPIAINHASHIRFDRFSTPTSSSFGSIPASVVGRSKINTVHLPDHQFAKEDPERCYIDDLLDEQRLLSPSQSHFDRASSGKQHTPPSNIATAETGIQLFNSHSTVDNTRVHPSDVYTEDTEWNRSGSALQNNTDGSLESDSIYEPGSQSEASLTDFTAISEEFDTDVDTDTSTTGSNQEPNRLPEAAQLITSLLSLERIGCGIQVHQSRTSTQVHTCTEGNCKGLAATYTDRDFLIHKSTSTAPRANSLGIESSTFPDPAEFGRSNFIHAARIRPQFEGCPSKETSPQHICLHQEDHPGPGPNIEYDIDGLIVFPESFASFHRPYKIEVSFSKQIRYNIKSNLHIKLPVSFIDSNGRAHTQKRELRTIPHLYLGSVPHFHLSGLFVMFPHLISEDTKTSLLTDQQAAKFLQIWLGICCKFLSTPTGQHLPPDHATAESKASAKGRERQSAPRENALKEHRAYPIMASALQRGWKRLQRTINETPGLHIFKDAQLFLNAKNTKLHESSSTLLSTLQTFKMRLKAVFHTQQLRYFLDVGVKIVPSGPSYRQRNVFDEYLSDEELQQYMESLPEEGRCPATYLWKACCLEHLYQRLQEAGFDGKQGVKHIYHNGYLRDATTMTIEPPARSWIRKAGFVYIQCYNSAKEIEDAGKVRPFDHEHLANLALAAELSGSDTLYSRRDKLVQSYCASKQRANQSYESFRSTTLGIRLEVRINEQLYDTIIQQLEDDNFQDTEETVPTYTEVPSFAWNIPTAAWCDFVRGNLNKITSAIEMIVLTCPKEGIPKATSELLFLLFMYLQNFSNCQLPRYSLLWKDEESRKALTRRGMNLRQSVADYGFGWLPPCIDWHGLRLRFGYVGRLIGCETIGVAYKSSLRLLQDQQGIMELCYKVMTNTPEDSIPRKKALRITAHFILRQYRRDIFEAIGKKELHEEFQSKDAQDEIRFCHTDMCIVLVQKPWYVNNWKVMGARDPTDLFRFLMTTEAHQRPRKSLDGPKQKRWRKMIFTMDRVVHSDTTLQAQWKNILLREFQLYFTVWPYPDPCGVFIELESSTKQRKFFSAAIEGPKWKWTGAEPTLKTTPPYPIYLQMTFEQIKEYLHSQ